MPSLSRVLSAVVLVALAGGPLGMAPAFAQSGAPQNASTTVNRVDTVTGTVTDSSGAPVSGATITLKGAKTYTATSTARGQYALAAAPGLYTATVVRSGYESGTEQDVAVEAGTSITLNIQLVSPTLSSLRVIGATQTSISHAAFNASPATVNVVSNQAFLDQGQPQVKSVLNEIPGLQISLPATSGNGSAPGAITFPNIRGGLSFETASLIDGHPVSVGAYGDYVTTFLNSFLLQSVEVVKGPGASSPEVNYAIGGTVNFRTLDPTLKPSGNETFGTDSFGGTFSNIGYSATVANGKLGFVVDYAVDGTPGALSGLSQYAPVSKSWSINGHPIVSTPVTTTTIPGTNQTRYDATSTLLYQTTPLVSTYTSKDELVKLKLNVSSATSITASYLGSQTWTDQNANHLYNVETQFSPSLAGAPAYTMPGGPQAGPLMVQDNTYPYGEWEINNEPIFQGELHTTLGNNNILARAYTASISRLQYMPLNAPGAYNFSTKLYGPVTTCTVALVSGACPAGFSQTTTYTGQSVNVTYPSAYFNDDEEDRLHGYSFEFDHPFADTGNTLSFAADYTSSETGKYNISTFVPGGPVAASVPPTSGQNFTTILARYIGNLGPRTQLTFSNYLNTYVTHYSQDNGATFLDQRNSHFDQRLGLTYRLDRDTSLRASAGSAIAPPYIGLYSRVNTAPTLSQNQLYATNTQANPNLRPETSFGYDLGADHRFRDGATVLSGDVYLTNLWNQLISTATFLNGVATVTKDSSGHTIAPVQVPLYTSGSTNLAQARYEGIELALRRAPSMGIGYLLQGSLQHAYAYNLPLSFYAAPGSTVPTRNLGIVPGVNFYGGYQGVSNQPIPYSQGYAEISYTSRHGARVSLGENYYGPNNSYFLPAFFIANANGRLPLGRGFALNVNVDNLFNALSNDYITEYGGITQPLVNGAMGGSNPITGAVLNANAYGPRDVRISLSKTFGR